MTPEPIYKRRHFGTPQSMLLIITNFIVLAVLLTLCGKNPGWFFWVSIGLLALYNFSNIRKDRESYDKTRIIAYIISIVVMIILFFLFKYKG
jgi:hypothetical protein